MHNWLIYVPVAIVALGLVGWAMAKQSKIAAARQKWGDDAYDDGREFIQNYQGPFWQIVESVPGIFLVQHASFAEMPMASEWTPRRGRWEPSIIWTTQSTHTSRRDAERDVANRTTPEKDFIVVARYDYHGRRM